MRHLIAGAAGHIDHGKTALVRALTGIDTDRLEEEKRRGISIDIGFAHLDLEADTRVALIDVPGHEKFIKNMLAGVGGIDFVLLVIAADESIKPQTREHFDICRLLRIQSGVVVLTKRDLIDEDTLEVVKLEVEDFVRGSFLENAAIIPVSTVTGEGLPSLKSEMLRLAARIEPRDARQHLRLPLDRSFVMPGFGPVVTGTVFAGAVQLEDEVQAYPMGHILRVRGLQVHGTRAERAEAGQRTALNVTGADHSELRRGMTLGPAGLFRPAQLIDCILELLPSAKPLKNRAPVHFHAGTAEVIGEVRTQDNAALIEPGATTMVRIALAEPLLLLPSDRFIIRMFSPVVTIGGGEVLDSDPPRRIRRDALLSRSRRLASGSLVDSLELLVSEAPQGLAVTSIAGRTGLKSASILSSMPRHVHRFGDWLLHESAANRRRQAFREYLATFHNAHPLLPGCSKEELRTRELPFAPPQVFDALIAIDPAIVTTGEFLRLANHTIAFQEDEKEARTRIESAFESAGLHVPPLTDVLRSSGVDGQRARTLLQLLLRDKLLIRVSEDLVFHAGALSSLRQKLAERKGQRFGVGDFKDWTGVSRKYAIPLLEWLDRERVTRRDGEARLVL